jgi:hypothetical protein
MRGMHEFNPVLGFSTLAEYMFTPRGIQRLIQKSVRTLRRQTNVMTDVGEDLVEGGLRAVKRPFQDRPEEEEPKSSKPEDPSSQ